MRKTELTRHLLNTVAQALANGDYPFEMPEADEIENYAHLALCTFGAVDAIARHEYARITGLDPKDPTFTYEWSQVVKDDSELAAGLGRYATQLRNDLYPTVRGGR